MSNTIEDKFAILPLAAKAFTQATAYVGQKNSRKLTVGEIATANKKHANPEFIAAGKGRFVVIVNEDGLKKLNNDGRISSSQYERIKHDAIESIETIKSNEEEFGNGYEPNENGERNRYVLIFDSERNAVYAMSGELSVEVRDLYPDNDRYLKILLPSGLNLKDSKARADRARAAALNIYLDTDFTLRKAPNIYNNDKRPPADRLADAIMEWPEDCKKD